MPETTTALRAPRRYSIACRHCDGSGFHEGDDSEGNRTLSPCACYRGRVTILLTPDDERELLLELQKNVVSTTTGIPADRA